MLRKVTVLRTDGGIDTVVSLKRNTALLIAQATFTYIETGSESALDDNYFASYAVSF